MVLETRSDWNDLILRIARVTAQLHQDEGDRSALMVERANLWKEAQETGLFRPKCREGHVPVHIEKSDEA